MLGKPDPAVLLEAARRLAVPPAECLVIDDAVVGIQAACRAGFGLVIGVDRPAREPALLPPERIVWSRTSADSICTR